MILRRDIQKIQDLDRELISIIQDFLILGPLSWSVEVQHKFLSGVQKKSFVLPKVSYPKVDHSEKISRIKTYIKKLGKADHPAIAFLKDTAQSYLYAYYILQGVGTAKVSEYSRKLYGGPDENLRGYKRSNLEIAKYFLRVVTDYQHTVPTEPDIYNANQFRRALRKQIGKYIDMKKDPINVTVDKTIAARATSGPNYVKIRKGTNFSRADLMQLFHHEVMTHTLTYINGRKQPVLLSLGYSAPRVTATQEGLAVFSEYMNTSIDLVRLKRIALRIVAIDMAEKGANLVELFNFFRDNGQNDEESYYSAMRIFRGGTAKGGIVFYKDNVYLKGLIQIESFLKEAMHRGMVHDISVLFAGKLTVDDVHRFHPLIEQGYIMPPAYMPEWATKSGELAAHLALNDLTEQFKV